MRPGRDGAPLAAAVTGEFSRLTGYGAGGEVLGSVVCLDGPTPEPSLEPAPGWERVRGPGGEDIGNIVYRRIRPADGD